MIELIYIIAFNIILIIATTIPFSVRLNEINKINYKSYAEILINNIIIFLFIITVFSILLIKIKYVLIFLSTIYSLLILNIFYQKKIKLFFNEKLFLLNLLILFNLCIFSFEIANNLQLAWDGQQIWFNKTLAIYNDKNILKTIFPNYPNVGPYIWAFFWKISIFNNEYYGRIFQFLILIIAIIYSLDLKEKFENKKIITFYLIFFYIFILSKKLVGHQEILIFSLMLVLAKKVYVFLNIQNVKNLNIVLILGLILTWIKNEAAIMILIILFSLVFFSKVKKNSILIIIFIIFLLIHKNLIYNFYYNINFNFQSGNYENSAISIISQIKNIFNLDRNILFFYGYIKTLFKNLIFILFFFTIIVGLKKFKLRKFFEVNINIYLFIFIIFNLFLFFIYMFTSIEISHHIASSADRIMLQMSGFMLYPIILKLINNENTII